MSALAAIAGGSAATAGGVITRLRALKPMALKPSVRNEMVTARTG